MAKRREKRELRGNVATKMAEADGWVMVRFANCMPFCFYKNTWEELPLVAAPTRKPK